MKKLLFVAVMLLLAVGVSHADASIGTGAGYFWGAGESSISVTASTQITTLFDKFPIYGDLFATSEDLGAGISTDVLPVANQIAEWCNGSIAPPFQSVLGRISVGTGVTWSNSKPFAPEDVHAGLYWRLNVLEFNF